MSSDPVYPFRQLEYGETLEVAPGIHWVRMPLPFALNHINLWLLEDGDGWTVVDTGYNHQPIKDHWDRIIGEICGDKPVTRTIVTHFHPDHIGLAGWFHETRNTQLWITYPEWLQGQLAYIRKVSHDFAEWARFYVQNGLDPEKAAGYEKMGEGFNDAYTPIPRQLQRISHGDEIDIGGRSWRIITGGGHSPDHAALYCDEINVLLSGDQVLPRITTNVSVWFTEPNGDPLREYLESLDHFRELPEDVLVLPSHNFPFTGLHDRLAALVEHHEERLDAAAEFCSTSKNAIDVLPVLFHRELDDHQLTFAIGEAIAHLNYLVTDGRLDRVTDADGQITYRQPGA